ncbi:class I SAM-dependent methyltransferase [Kitasatospora cinereorecta]|uniref:Class I SAM-dependent methyltransferase n=1 Tax=Kitasatospora cinereorecta TaxID=285560 RepID=A0ABW0VKU1_9ACTN
MDSHAWDARYAAADLVWGTEPNRWVAAETADLPPGRALDLAAGEGRNSLWLAARGWRVTAVDFAAVAIDRARRLAAQLPADVSARVDLVRADLLDYRPEEGGYDLVVIAYLQLPGAAMGAVLRTAAGALAPGGTLLLVGHDATNLTDGTGGPQDPAVLHTPDGVLAHLDGLGLATDRAERVRRPVARPDGTTADAIDTLVRVHRPTI